jgi:hypothetical protein
MSEDAERVAAFLEVRVGGRRLARYAEDDSEAARLGAWMAANREGADAVIVRVSEQGGGEQRVGRVRPNRAR